MKQIFAARKRVFALLLTLVWIAAFVPSISLTADAASTQKYTVTLVNAVDASGNALSKWSGNGGKLSFTLSQSGYKSVYAKPVDSTSYYISDVTAEPADGAAVTYDSGTGEVFVENIKTDITLIPVVAEKKTATNLEVEYRFVEGGVYSEENPAVQVEFTVTAKDQAGSTVPNAKVYFKQDESEVSSTLTRVTGSDGTATFVNSYALEDGTTEGTWTAQFALDSKYATGLAEQDIRIVLQTKDDLVLYEHQIFGTLPGENNGRIITVPETYQIWTGEVHQGAIVVGSGEWQDSVNGEFTGLSAGQHVIRFGERADYETNTFYLASDYADFFVPRGVWNITLNLENAEFTGFAGEANLVAEPGGTVYVYVAPEAGYEITSFEVDKPNYVSGSVTYSEEDGFIVIEGVTGDIVLTVAAEKI